MRPLISRYVKSRPWKTSLGLAALLTAGFVPAANSCFSPPPDDSAMLSIELAPGVHAQAHVTYFAPNDFEVSQNPDAKGVCTAGVNMPLSAFPSVSNRLGTETVAAAIQESIDLMELKDCEVWVYYENDVGADFAENELCVKARYEFGGGSRWETQAESNCWEPVNVVVSDNGEEEMLISYVEF